MKKVKCRLYSSCCFGKQVIIDNTDGNLDQISIQDDGNTIKIH